MTIKFTIPGNPYGKGRPNARIVHVTGGKSFVNMYTPSETVAQEKIIAQICRYTMGPRKPFSCPLGMEVVAYHPIPTSWSKKDRAEALVGTMQCVAKPDLDNVVKLVLDALNRVAYEDDKQVISLTAKKFYSSDPRVEVIITV